MFYLRKTVGSMRMLGAWETTWPSISRSSMIVARPVPCATPLECCGTCVRGFAQLVNTAVATELCIR